MSMNASCILAVFVIAHSGFAVVRVRADILFCAESTELAFELLAA